ncbi:MAG: hypothetical protein K6D02_01865 [Lachnospiraceae bacterium]|nr:hypothetical protein [Lachnospiraceae bacterium]
MTNKQTIEQKSREDCISREKVCEFLAEFINHEYSTDIECEMVNLMIEGIKHLPSVKQEPNTDVITVLTEIQLKIEEHKESIIGRYDKDTKENDFPSHKIERNNGRKECIDLIQQKIDKLKETQK